MKDKPRVYTAEETRDMFLSQLHQLVQYWEKQNGNVTERMSGLVFSILNIFDGTTMELPALDIVARPHPDNKSYSIKYGENYYEDGTILNSDCMLHELWYKPLDAMPASR